ncbi:uncharacterized protein LOC108093026 [Drosophila ficusphila]|uniref:uncharacterized protein LOC108093026 n=1 Tax=Drosophila ficusphila TaxID=30025 RepID=UPI0007E8269A|nr:uncharacterized protein LOC108093026 [Drosophila ficusphila]
MEYSNTTGLNHIIAEEPQNPEPEQPTKTRLSVIGSYFKIESPTGPQSIALGSQRCLNTPPTTPSSPLREAPQSPSDGHVSSLSSHSGSGCSDILLGKLSTILSPSAGLLAHDSPPLRLIAFPGGCYL